MTSLRICECCEAEEGDSKFIVDRNGDAYCPECHTSLVYELQRMIDALPKRIALCPQCAPEFYLPLEDGDAPACPTSGCNLDMIVYERAVDEQLSTRRDCPACQPNLLKTPEEWERELCPGTRIIDPDGWRGAGGRPWTDPITREEFEKRRVWSSIIGFPL